MSVSLDVLGGIGPGVAYKSPCAAATIGPLVGLIGLAPVDGYTPQIGDRILVWLQQNPADNGIYTAQLGAWSRTIDFTSAIGVAPGTQVYVVGGTIYGNTVFVLQTPQPVIFGTTPIIFKAYSFSPGAGAVKGTVRKISSGSADVATAADWLIGWNSNSGAPKAQTIPSPSVVPGQQLIIKDIFGDAWANNITITPTSGTIDGAATAAINNNKQSLTLVADGNTNWELI